MRLRSKKKYKCWLVKEIGFGGMLELPMIQKLNLRLSSWCMSKVDVRRRAVVINSKKFYIFSAADVAMMFGIRSGNRDVFGPDGNINEAASAAVLSM